MVSLLDGYTELDGGKRLVLKLDPKIAPFKVAVFPLLANKQDLVDKAMEVKNQLVNDLKSNIDYDARGNIGKRYFSQDEAGTPWCVTIDFKTLDDNTVTVRDRDSTKQERLDISKLEKYFSEKLVAS